VRLLIFMKLFRHYFDKKRPQLLQGPLTILEVHCYLKKLLRRARCLHFASVRT
jgi:hypothetical protein